MKKSYVVSYDITDDRMRTKASETLKDYGTRVQKSVFECRLRKKAVTELKGKLEGLIDMEQDSILIYPLCKKCIDQKQSMGVNTAIREEAFQIL